jgi:hypothetical protein
VEDVLLDFRQRYLKDPEMLRALVALVKEGMPAESLDRVLYFQAARSDPLLHDLVAEVLTEWTSNATWRFFSGTVASCLRRPLLPWAPH